jgi:nucleoid-associated protein YgaU
MAPSKLTIEPEFGQLITVMFNPNSYSITKSVVWTPSTVATADVKANAPVLSFGGGEARVLELDLFFDTTDEPNPEARDVRVQTDAIVQLTRITPDKGRPPLCTVSWGGGGGGGGGNRQDFPFKGVVTNLSQNFVLFDGDGRPLRAQLKVRFTEFVNREDDARRTDPEATTRVVRRGDSLASIAADVYRDPGAWRLIAVANGIDDPFKVPAGSKLTLPQA